MGKKFLPYFLLAVLSALFSSWFWNWGLQQKPVTSLDQVPSFFSTTSIVASILFFGSAWWVLHKFSKDSKTSFSVLGGLTVWYLAVIFLGRLDFFAARPLFAPNIFLAFILLAIAIKKLLSSSKLQSFFESVPLNWIMSVQTFRVMGVGFLSLYYMKLLPGEFAIPTGLGDIAIGITAPIVAFLYTLGKSYSKKIAILWNYAGIFDLLMAITLGMLTYSKPFQFLPTEIPNDPIALFPLIIIPVFAVPLSIILHLFSLRVLRK